MELQLFGINHKTSVISEREKFIINESNQIILDNHLKRIFKDDFESFFGISTCNRTEIYFVGKQGIINEVFNEVLKILDINNIPKKCFYFLTTHNALAHMCKVASGIDSQVLGEQEIFGQFKTAFKKSSEHNMVGKKLSFFTKKVIEITKIARTNTEIGLNPLSVSGLTIKLINNIFEKPDNQNVLVVGAGSLALSVMDNLYRIWINNINSVNRTIKNIKLVNGYEIVSSALDTLHDQLKFSDIVVASATAEIPLIGKGAIENALSFRKNKPILIIDLGVQLEAFLQNLSSVEIKQFNETKDYSELIKSIKTLNINDSKLNNYEDIKQIDDHIIESMIKRFFSNA